MVQSLVRYRQRKLSTAGVIRGAWLRKFARTVRQLANTGKRQRACRSFGALASSPVARNAGLRHWRRLVIAGQQECELEPVGDAQLAKCVVRERRIRRCDADARSAYRPMLEAATTEKDTTPQRCIHKRRARARGTLKASYPSVESCLAPSTSHFERCSKYQGISA